MTMTMPLRLRKFMLTAHVISSVGWLGAAAAYLVLAVDVLADQDAQAVRAAILVMELIAWFVIVPFAFASLLTGIVQSVGTTWGLFRHYWVLFKLLLNIFAVFVLLEYTTSLSQLAGVAAKTTLSSADLNQLKDPGHIVHSGGGLLALLVATVLAVYKPRGVTRYGQRKQHEQRRRQRGEFTKADRQDLEEAVPVPDPSTQPGGMSAPGLVVVGASHRPASS